MKIFKKINLVSLMLLLVLTLMPVVHAEEIIKRTDVDNVITLPGGEITSSPKVTIANSVSDYELRYQYIKLDDDKVSSFNDLWEEYEDEVDESSKVELANSIFRLFENNVTNNWKDATSTDEVPFTDNVTKQSVYVLWVELTVDKNTIYDAGIIDVPANINGNNDSEPSPETGDSMIMVAIGAIAIGGIMIASYRKAHN